MDLTSIGVCLRTYENNPRAAAFTSALLAYGVGHVVMRLKPTDDAPSGTVRGVLAYHDDLSRHGNRLTFDERPWTWSVGLNEGARALAVRAFEYVLNISTEVGVRPTHIHSMLNHITRNPEVVMVGTTFSAYSILDGERHEVDLGPTYTNPRNTMSLIRTSSITAPGGVGYFNLACEQLGGMEDVEWAIRAMEGGHEVKMLDMCVPLLVGANWDQDEKQLRERQAVADILKHRRESLGGDTDALARFEEAVRGQWYAELLEHQ